MPVSSAIALLCAVLAVASLLGWALRARSNRAVRGAGEIIDPARLGADALGADATLLQFSTQSCQRCPSVHDLLSSVASARDGVRHLDIDLTDRPDIARHFEVVQLPTTLVLDHTGSVQARFGGAPGRGVIELELDRLITHRV